MSNFLKIALGIQENEDLFSEGHFGESNKFLIYKYDISQQKMELVDSFVNTSAEERMSKIGKLFGSDIFINEEAIFS